MALVIVLTNQSNLAPVSDYTYGVFINERQIAGGSINGHTRADGWQELIKKMLEADHGKEFDGKTDGVRVRVG